MESLTLTRPYSVGEWRVEPALDEMHRAGVRVKLEPRMTRLLSCLAARPGEVLSISELLDQVWTGVVVSPSSVYQAVAHLRRLLGDVESTPRYIATVPRRGYRLVAAVRPNLPPEPLPSSTGGSTVDIPAGAPEHPAATHTPEPPAPHSRAKAPARRPLRLVAAAAAVVLAVAVIAIRVGTDAQPDAVPTTPTAVAVLPFADLSADASNRAFCDGLTDELLNSLARLPGLRVTGRTSTARFRDGAADPQQVGAMLDVTHLLEGSVRRSGSRLRISAQLVRTDDGFQVWANSFDRPADDVITIQSQIASAVADALELQLSPDAAARLERAPTTRINAYEFYLLGRHQQLKRSAEGLSRAVDYHQAALAADPGFALAHAGLADAYMAGYYYAGRPLDETARLVQGEVDAALRLDPELAEAYAAWAVLLTEQWRLTEAIAALKRALAINSNYSEAYLRLGAAYEYAGEPLEALSAYEQVKVLDPLNTVLHVRRCLVLQNLGRYPEAEAACQRGFELQPDIPNALWAHGLAAYAQGDLPAAVGHYRAALARAADRADIRAELAILLLDLDLRQESAREFEQARQTDPGLQRALAQGRWFLAAGDLDGLRRFLRRLPLDSATPRERLDAAFLALAARDTSLASGLGAVGGGPAGTPYGDDLAPGVYRTRWGVCELCSLALLSRAAGDAASATAHSDVAAAALDRMQERGHVWHGLHYLRAGLQAQQGQGEAAIDSLEQAVDLGWRRAWLMRADPALEPVRSDPRFTALLEKIDVANGLARERLATASGS